MLYLMRSAEEDALELKDVLTGERCRVEEAQLPHELRKWIDTAGGELVGRGQRREDGRADEAAEQRGGRPQGMRTG